MDKIADKNAAIEKLRAIVGPKGVVDDPDLAAPLLQDWRGRLKGKAALILQPESTAEIAAILKICNDSGLKIVPQSGNTGLVGASVPNERGEAILLSLRRMNRIRSLSTQDLCATAEAGCILANIESAAREKSCHFPLTLGSAGSAQIGGMVATNAGGILTIRHGNMRDQILGLEIVLANGDVLSSLTALRKNNAGYDLKQLFIGSEGTLGVITAASLRLIPAPRSDFSALFLVKDVAGAVELLFALRAAVGEIITAYELMAPTCIHHARRYDPALSLPFADSQNWWVLARFQSGESEENLRPRLEETLAALIEKGMATDGALAASVSQAAMFWRLREAVVEAQKPNGFLLKHDIAVPIAKLPVFFARAETEVKKIWPAITLYPFGHVGDGSIHFNAGDPTGQHLAEMHEKRGAIADKIHRIALEEGGTLSAEHGIGRFKREDLQRNQDPIARAAMVAVKRAFDPRNTLNPGVLFGEDEIENPV